VVEQETAVGSNNPGHPVQLSLWPLDAVSESGEWATLLEQAGAVVRMVSEPASTGVTVVLIGVDAEPRPISLGSGASVVPVVLGSTASLLFSDQSQIIVAEQNPSTVCQRIVNQARLGSGKILAWNALATRANEWSVRGRREQDLLPSGDLSQAQSTALLRSQGISDRTVELVTQYVTASRSRADRRSRRVAIVALGVVVALIASTVVAGYQRTLSLSAAAAANLQDRVSTSERLASQAEALIGADPDLPWLLVQNALHVEPTERALSTAQAVMAGTAPHVSIPLGSSPRALDASPTGNVIATLLDDGSVQVRTGAGELVFRTDPTGETTGRGSIAVSPTGSLIAVGGNAPAMVNTSTHESVSLPSVIAGSQLPVVWLTSTTAAFGTRSGVVLINAESLGSPVVIPPTRDEGQVMRMAVHLASQKLATITPTGVHVINLTSGLEIFTAALSGQQDVAFSSDGKRLEFFSAQGRSQSLDLSAASATITDDFTTVFGQYRVSSSDNSREVVVSGPSVAYNHEAWLAARGPIVGAAWISSTSLATVGGDSYLRIWDLAGKSSYAIGGSITMTAGGQAGNRSRIRPSTTGSLTESMTDGGGQAAVVDPQSPPTGKQGWYIPGSRNQICLATSVGVIGVVDGARIRIMDLQAGKVLLLEQVPSKAYLTLQAIESAISDKGSAMALSTGTETAIFRVGLSQQVLSTPATAAVSFVGETLYVVAQDGSLTTVDPSGRRGTQRSLSIAGLAKMSAGSSAGLAVLSSDRVVTVRLNGQEDVQFPVAPEMDPIALSLSEDGRWVAVIGSTETQVLEAGSGRQVLRVENARNPIEDVAVVGSSAYGIHHDGGVQRFTIGGESAGLAAGSPRPLTDEEARTLDLGAFSLVGGR
jgi:hypothetical protein